MSILKPRSGHKLSGQAAKNYTLALTEKLSKKTSLGGNRSFFKYAKLPKHLTKNLRDDYSDIIDHNGRIKPRSPEKRVFELHEKLREQGRFKYDKRSSFRQSQNFLKTTRALETMPEQDARQYLTLGPNGFEKTQKSQAAPQKPKEIGKLQKQIKAYARLGPSQEDKIRTLESEVDKLNIDWLRKKDPTGKEAKKYIYNRGTQKLNQITQSESPSKSQSPPLPPTIDVLGPEEPDTNLPKAA